jgi:O-antigen/teichoic acid export membrane protein
VFANWLGMAINMGVAFLLSPYLVHSLGDTMYGLWILLLAVTGYMGLLDAGLKVSVVKYVSRYNATGDTDAISRVVSTVLALHAAISVAIVVIASALAPVLPQLFAIPADVVPIARVVLVITAINLAISLVASVFNGVLAGLQRYDYANAIGVAIVLVRSALIVLAVSQGGGIVALGFVHTAGQIAAGLLVMAVVFRTVPDLRIRLSLVNRDTVKTLYGFGAFVLLNNLAMFFLFNSAEIVIGVFLSAAAVTYYAIAGSLLQYLSQLIGVMTQVLHPYASDRDAKGDTGGLQRTVVLGTKACLMIALPATVTFVLVGRPFIALWMGPSYADAAAPLLVVLAIGRLFWLSQSSAGNVLLGAGRHKLLTLTNLATGVAGLGLGAVLIRPMGLFGLALGMTIPMVVTQGLLLPRITMRAFSIPAAAFLREAYVQPLLGTLPYAVALAALMTFVRPGSLPVLALTVAAAAPALVGGMYFICLSKPQRSVLRQAYGRWLPSPAHETGSL